MVYDAVVAWIIRAVDFLDSIDLGYISYWLNGFSLWDFMLGLCGTLWPLKIILNIKRKDSIEDVE